MHNKCVQLVYKRCKHMCINISVCTHKPQLQLNIAFNVALIHFFSTAVPLFLHNQNLNFISINSNFLHNIHKPYNNNYI